ncbi:MAG TPA: iron-sulfur cluster repair di-iron protein [Thermoanaerobaculia bacterium]|nr:iron-sulfur cluster repair di-iron protein [Thermoanaerobaculia bacterium]HQR67361.1 iron-sulfur cluster repair di-iron protein [Thermoanaerobaculia bacterium]
MSFEAGTIADLAIANPNAIPALEKLGIDYCCGGAATVAEACRRAGVSPEQLLALVGSADRPAGKAWDREPLSKLLEFIVGTHHVYTRQAIASLPPLATKVQGRHGPAHPETRRVEELVHRLAADLAPHLQKEEQILFPYIAALEEASGPGGAPAESCFGTVRNPIRMMMMEHDTAGELLRQLRATTNGYTLPGDACTSFQALYAGLTQLEEDLHRHIHLENNILFPRAIELEQAGRRT